MKKLLSSIALFSACFNTASFAQNCNPPLALIQNYEHEIASMAVDYMFSTSQDTDQILVPAPHFDFVAEAMAAVFNSDLPERDSIFDIFCVHSFSGLGSIMNKREMIVFFDPAFAWTQAWINGGNTPTGNAQIDALISDNDFSVHDYQHYPDFPAAYQHRVLVSKDAIFNIDAALDALSAIPGITYAEVNSWIGGAGSISMAVDGNDKVFTFRHEWADCFDGCDEFIEWVISVDAACQVQLLSRTRGAVFGATPPPVFNCNISTKVSMPVHGANSISLAPNPAGEHIFLKFDLPENTRLNYVLTSAAGLQMRSGELIANSSPLDIADLPAGAYWIVFPQLGQSIGFLKLE